MSANVPFLAALAEVIGARFTPRPAGAASRLVVADSWPSRGTFSAERHRLELRESEWAEVREVRHRTAGDKPFTFYTFGCEPWPRFLVNGHLARQPF